jgi:hypothetical protein
MSLRRRLLRVVGVALFVALCAAGIYSNNLGLAGAAQPDATHTRLIQYGHGGPHYVTPEDFVHWEATWVVIVVLLLCWIAFLLVGWRAERGRWPWSH